MNAEEQTHLKFSGVDFVNVNFSASQPKERSQGGEIELEIIPFVLYPKDLPSTFRILLNISVRLKEYFDLRITAIGHFEVSRELDEKLKSLFVNQNSVAIMFPYIRAFVSNFTTSLGGVTGTITIPIQFFKGEIEELKEEPEKLIESN